MRAQSRVSRVVVLGVVIALGGSACGSGAPDTHAGHGIVREVDPGARQVTIDHEEIPGLMKGMTMTFDVAPEVRLEEIPPGAEVDFRLSYEDGVMTVTELRQTSP